MTRTYTMKRRAARQEETRQRIVEAAVALHSELGPARTPFTLVAERAGVQRHTLYAHFPDERSLLMACSGLTAERDPPPDAEAWRGIADRRARLHAGLGAIHAWFARNAQRIGCVLRDAEYDALTREIAQLRMGSSIRAWQAVLGEGLTPAQQAVLRVMTGFPAWRSLTRDSGLSADAAVEAAVAAVLA